MRYNKHNYYAVSDGFGENLRRLRQEQKISQEELGKAAGITRKTVARYESGETKMIEKNTVKSMSDFLGYDIESGYMNDTGKDRLNSAEISKKNMEIRNAYLQREIDELKERMKQQGAYIATLQIDNKKLRDKLNDVNKMLTEHRA